MGWLNSYSTAAARTDRFRDRRDHLLLLAAGMLGEAGSILAEIKKMKREAKAYPGYRQRLMEELGDFLWYYVRLAAQCDSRILNGLPAASTAGPRLQVNIGLALDLGSAVGQVLHLVQKKQSSELKTALKIVWAKLLAVAERAGINLEEASRENLAKIQSRWPAKKIFHPLFDEDCPAEEQIPRNLTVEFLARSRGRRVEVLLRCNNLIVGDRITDNIPDSDGYRYHDIFHFAYAVFLGWSPVVRALLRCKRKSDPAADENQDGARAIIIEEAVSAIVFSRAKEMRFFKDANQVDYDLLKSIQEFVRGYEVDQVPLWQWEMAILEGCRVFRLLRSGPGGQVTWDRRRHTLDWAPMREPKEAKGV